MSRAVYALPSNLYVVWPNTMESYIPGSTLVPGTAGAITTTLRVEHIALPPFWKSSLELLVRMCILLEIITCSNLGPVAMQI